MKLLQIVDSIEYVSTNSIQKQLLETLRETTDHTVIDMLTLFQGGIDFSQYDRVLCTLKLRTLKRNLFMVKNYLKDTPVYVYEQDPWESFTDEANFPGTYEEVFANLNVASFLNTSKWWSEHIKSKGMPSKFVKMWMLPRLCRYGRRWGDRSVRVGFKGTVHAHRQKSFDRLAQMGVHVQVLPVGDYASFLDSLADMKFFIHDESEKWHIGGQAIGRNSLWTKEIEVTSQGCFCLRNYEPEGIEFGALQNPLILTFEKLEDVPGLIQTIEEMPIKSIENKRGYGVDLVKMRNEWLTVVEALA